ncbi:MAG: DsbE family thiol:disulfide interchange protein [Rhodocyclales bacterium GT-UBC]|nr:MAG: DsbE family thiol:disulfide interchange protein [Rhodocyclales bacterium GT-UBC]
MRRFILPLLLFAVLVGFLAVGLRLNPRELPSPFIGKPAPLFRLSQLHAAEESFSPEDMRGRVWLLNVWASWCVSCRQEHPVLMDLARHRVVPIIGLDYKDEREPAKAWLAEQGNPYGLSVWDREGKVGIDYGVYGVPETFVIDKSGIVRMKHTGPVTPAVLSEKIIPLIKELNGA